MKLTILVLIYLFAVFLALSIVYGLLRKALDPEHRHAGGTIIVSAVLGVLFMFPLIGALVPDGPVCWFFQKWGNILAGYMVYFFGMLLVVRVIEGIVRLRRRRRTGEKQPISRKYAVTVLAVLFIGAIAINVFGSLAAHDIKTTFYELPRETLGQKEPLRVVLIADTHIGVNTTPTFSEEMVARVNEQNPDLVVVAGDILTSSYGAMRQPDAYSSILSQIKAKKGKYVVYGNHDVDEPLLSGFTFIGAENAHRNPEMEQFIQDCDWTLLKDDVVRLPELEGLCIAGRRDESRPGDGVKERASLEEVLKDTNPQEHILLLQHEPSDLEELDRYGIDLSVSGHTHDGQIFPGNVLTRIVSPQSYGMKKWGDTSVIVTSGVGYYGPPIRVGTISEIVVIDFK